MKFINFLNINLNREYREDVLDMHIFENIQQVRYLTDAFTEDYNHKHPHNSLGDMTPTEFLHHRSKKSLYLL